MCTADMLRRVAYMSVQLGGCGYTYGAQGIWDNVLEKGQGGPMSVIFNHFDIPWYEAVEGIGADQMGYMKSFYEKVHFEDLIPYQEPDHKKDINPFTQKTPLVRINESQDRLVIYYEDSSRSSSKLHGLLGGEYQAIWFNPRTGEYSTATNYLIQVEGEWEIPAKKDVGDWILIMEKSILGIENSSFS